MNIRKIVITGGPSAGKTTGMTWIQNAFTKLGYTVLFVPETATEFITGGVAPWTCGTNLDYQKVQMRLQLEKERLFEQAARTMKAERILIVCDRGALDNRAYMDEEEFQAVLEDVGRSREELLDSYDAVFHMVTAAKGAERFYTTENNAARYEAVEEAVQVDDRLIAAWAGHRHLRVIDNSVDFEDKLKRLIAEIRAFLGEPEPMDVKRRFLIVRPETAWLESQPGSRRVEIVQTYLLSRAGDEIRLRRRTENGTAVCYKTSSRLLAGGERIELEESLSREEYQSLLMEADPSRRPLEKTRYWLTWEGRQFEIDLYPFWEDQALLEIEQSGEDQPVHLPPELQLLREISGSEVSAALEALR